MAFSVLVNPEFYFFLLPFHRYMRTTDSQHRKKKSSLASNWLFLSPTYALRRRSLAHKIAAGFLIQRSLSYLTLIKISTKVTEVAGRWSQTHKRMYLHTHFMKMTTNNVDYGYHKNNKPHPRSISAQPIQIFTKMYIYIIFSKIKILSCSWTPWHPEYTYWDIVLLQSERQTY